MPDSVVVGVVHRGRRDCTARLLNGLLRQSQGTRRGPSESVVLDRVGLAVADSSAPPHPSRVAMGNGIILAVTGTVFDTEFTHGFGQPDCQALLARVIARGVAALEGLNGEYLAALWEERDDRLTIINDRFGLRRLYYWTNGQRFLFTPNLYALSRSDHFPQTIDECALADYLQFGHHLEGRTWFAAARHLLPASTLTFAKGQLSVRTYWQFQFATSPSNHRLRHYLSDRRLALEAAIRRRLPISGETVAVWSSSTNASDDIPAALRRAERAHVNILSCDLECATLQSDTGIISALISGSNPCHSVRLARLATLVPQEHGTLFTGHLAKLFAIPIRRPARPFPTEVDQRVPATLRPIFQQEELRQILRPEVYRLVHDVATDSLIRSHPHARDESIEERIVQLFLRQQQHHESPLDLERLTGACRVSAPFADPETVEAARIALASCRVGETAYDLAAGLQTDPCGQCVAHLHELSSLRAIRSAAPFLGDFFRLPTVLRHSQEGNPVEAKKLCLLTGLSLCLTALCTGKLPTDDQVVPSSFVFSPSSHVYLGGLPTHLPSLRRPVELNDSPLTDHRARRAGRPASVRLPPSEYPYR